MTQYRILTLYRLDESSVLKEIDFTWYIPNEYINSSEQQSILKIERKYDLTLTGCTLITTMMVHYSEGAIFWI